MTKRSTKLRNKLTNKGLQTYILSGIVSLDMINSTEVLYLTIHYRDYPILSLN